MFTQVLTAFPSAANLMLSSAFRLITEANYVLHINIHLYVCLCVVSTSHLWHVSQNVTPSKASKQVPPGTLINPFASYVKSM